MTEEVKSEVGEDDLALLKEMGLDIDRMSGAVKALSECIRTFGPANGVTPEEMTHAITFVAEHSLIALEDHTKTLATGKRLLALGVSQALEAGDLQSLAEAGVIGVPSPDEIEECPGCPECSDVSVH